MIQFTPTAAKSRVSVAEHLLRYLKQRGVTHVFGVVGREAAAILFDEPGAPEFVLTRHEFTAGVAADVQARISGTVAACFATLGPGITNLSTAVACAFLDRSPLIAIGAQAETTDGVPGQTHQCIDNVALMKPITKYSVEIRSAEELVPALERCFAAATEEPVGPAFISIPIDVLASPMPDGDVIRPHAVLAKPARPAADVSAAARALALSDAPVIAIGNAAVRSGAAQLLERACERHEIPAVTTYAAKGALPSGHPLSVGTLSPYMDGILRTAALEEIFAEADTIVLAGYDYAEDFRPSMWRKGRPKRVVRVGTIPNPAAQLFTPDVDLAGDVRALLEELFRQIGDVRFGPRGRALAASIAAARTRIANTGSGEGAITAQAAIAAINAAKDGDAIVVSDIGFFRHYAAIFTEVAGPNQFVTSGGGSSFGFGLPAALGAKLAEPDRQVIVVAGDGGFHSGSQDLETLARLGLGITIVVLNNNSNGLIRLYQHLGHGRDNPKAVDFGPVDFVALARANGCAGVSCRSTRDLTVALRAALHSGRPTVIEVPLRYDYEYDADFGALRI
jgi:acetolactate synthase-1/2/3 large subunit/N2-(2-carboxyethyl)arginine synthase